MKLEHDGKIYTDPDEIDNIMRKLGYVVCTYVDHGCLSTHGAAGYAYGSYWDGEDIVCVCGTRITDPQPTGARWQTDPGLRGFVFGHGKWVPTWPDWIWGMRGKPWKGCKHGYLNSDDCAECCH